MELLLCLDKSTQDLCQDLETHSNFEPNNFGNLLTKCFDTENYLFSFFDLRTVFLYSSLSKTNNILAKKYLLFMPLFEYEENYFFSRKFLIDWLVENEYIEVLQWLKKSKHDICHCFSHPSYIHGLPHSYSGIRQYIYTSTAIDLASKHGYIDILEWFKDTCKIHERSLNAIDFASENGQIEVLNWWKKYCESIGVKMKYTDNAISLAAGMGYVYVLEWWKSAIPLSELKYDYWVAVKAAAINGYVDVLEWFRIFRDENELSYRNNNMHRNWARNNDVISSHIMNAINSASANGHITVLEWWRNSRIEFSYDWNAIDRASENGHIDVLEWWKNSGLKLKYTHAVIKNAIRNNQFDVLEWWKNSGLDTKYDYRAIIRKLDEKN